ncbi:phosphoribosylanthranilate isomerase [Konateibacter massiliensis]|uniref:phosphoribosylanthranilate isomerase n=1 Tax=Konateibacter massiliensis TaxID=2002841 RepID=UPI000C14D551|nr:phosphoribosylanthranilate isomerase [Konateibacter massiliensis]
MTKIKICGITRLDEIKMLPKNQVDYVGMVVFFPKSKRNNTMENANILLGELKKLPVKTVAVTVSPTVNQVREIQEAGFDYIQIHGTLEKEAFDEIKLPILRAFNVTDLEKYEVYRNCPKVYGYLFDAAIPGSGKIFDWSLLDNVPRDEKLFILAGGLNSENVCEAIKRLKPDAVDVSSGVEGENGKDADKIKAFVNSVNKAGKEM